MSTNDVFPTTDRSVPDEKPVLGFHFIGQELHKQRVAGRLDNFGNSEATEHPEQRRRVASAVVDLQPVKGACIGPLHVEAQELEAHFLCSRTLFSVLG